jgi:hypothetical protein
MALTIVWRNPFSLVRFSRTGAATFNGAIYLKRLPNAIPAECSRGTYMLRAPYSNRQRTAMEAKWFTESPESRIEETWTTKI